MHDRRSSEEDWRELIYEYEDSAMNTEVNFELIKRVDEDTPIVDVLLDAYYASQ